MGKENCIVYYERDFRQMAGVFSQLEMSIILARVCPGMENAKGELVNVKIHRIVTVRNCCIGFVKGLRERLQTARRIGSQVS